MSLALLYTRFSREHPSSSSSQINPPNPRERDHPARHPHNPPQPVPTGSGGPWSPIVWGAWARRSRRRWCGQSGDGLGPAPTSPPNSPRRQVDTGRLGSIGRDSLGDGLRDGQGNGRQGGRRVGRRGALRERSGWQSPTCGVVPGRVGGHLTLTRGSNAAMGFEPREGAETARNAPDLTNVLTNVCRLSD